MSLTPINSTREFWINKSNIEESKQVERNKESGFQTGDLMLKINHFAFTSNNITYAALGKALKYWEFFPTKNDGWGIIPSWGFATVEKSYHEDIEEGEVIYGYFPMASHLKVSAGQVNDFGFVDVAPHREALSIIYNRYSRTKNDPSYQQKYEALQMLFQPLFITSFLIDDFLVEQAFMQAKQVVLTSASSKTATALAFILAQNKRQETHGIQVIGLTSSKNVSFVEKLGYYNQVYSYDQIDKLRADESTVVVDFAGNKDMLLNLLEQFGEALKHIALVGASHWDQRIKGNGVLGEKAAFFFAPTQAKKRIEEWGNAGFQRNLADVWVPFLQSASQWLEVKNTRNLAELYQEMLNGKSNPKEGHIVRL